MSFDVAFITTFIWSLFFPVFSSFAFHKNDECFGELSFCLIEKLYFFFLIVLLEYQFYFLEYGKQHLNFTPKNFEIWLKLIYATFLWGTGETVKCSIKIVAISVLTLFFIENHMLIKIEMLEAVSNILNKIVFYIFHYRICNTTSIWKDIILLVSDWFWDIKKSQKNYNGI